MEDAHKSQVAVKVTFPVSPKGPFDKPFERSATVGVVRSEAMAHFGVQEVGQDSYFLSHDGRKQADTTTLAEISEHAHEIVFVLIKEVIQG